MQHYFHFETIVTLCNTALCIIDGKMVASIYCDIGRLQLAIEQNLQLNLATSEVNSEKPQLNTKYKSDFSPPQFAFLVVTQLIQLAIYVCCKLRLLAQFAECRHLLFWLPVQYSKHYSCRQTSIKCCPRIGFWTGYFWTFDCALL